MSFESIFSKLCANLENVKAVSKKFLDLKNDDDRFKLTFDTCKDFITNLNFERAHKSFEKFSHLSKVGNSRFSQNQFWDSITIYNEALAFAPQDHLAVAYFQRSLALSKLGLEADAEQDYLEAVRLAEDSMKINLEKQREQVLGQGSFKPFFMGNGTIPSFSEQKSSFLESASSAVKYFVGDKCGRELIAETQIKTGQVLIVEKPYSSVLLPSHFYSHCSHCFRRSFNLKPCEKCCFAMYCSDKCLKESLESNHEVECNVLAMLTGLKFERMEFLSLRILLNASNQGKLLKELFQQLQKSNVNINEKLYRSQDFLNTYNLVRNTEKRTASDLFYRCVISAVIINLLEKYTNFFSHVDNKELFMVLSGGMILRFMQSLPCNAHEVSEFTEEGLQEIGAGVYATLSLINHSCDPNVVRCSCGDVVVLRAIKPIQPGEQIVDNYGYHYAMHNVLERQSALMKQYYFKCECEPCSKSWPTYENLPSEKPKFKKQTELAVYEAKTKLFQESLERIFRGDFNDDMIKENMDYLDFLDEFVVRPWQNYNKCQEAIKHCLCFSGNHFRFSKGVSY